MPTLLSSHEAAKGSWRLSIAVWRTCTTTSRYSYPRPPDVRRPDWPAHGLVAPADLVVVSVDLSRSDRHEPKLLGDLALCFVARGERPRLAGLQQRRNDDGCDCQMPGVHRTQRMLADE